MGIRNFLMWAIDERAVAKTKVYWWAKLNFKKARVSKYKS